MRRTLRTLRRGPGDPAFRVEPDRSIWRATRFATGVATVRLAQLGPQEVEARAWGPGADEALVQLPELLGALDDPSTFDPRLTLVSRAHQRHPGVRVMRTGRVM
ncbi:DNA-3-methyladenine glycosylase 2 family protein, partial [Solicola sp. PLA-1-18]